MLIATDNVINTAAKGCKWKVLCYGEDLLLRPKCEETSSELFVTLEHDYTCESLTNE